MGLVEPGTERESEKPMSDDYLHRYHNTDFSGALPPLHTFREAKRRGLEWLADNYGTLLPSDRNARVLDIGCGMGELLFFLKERGYARLEGVDVSAHLVEYCRQLVGCTVHCTGDLEGFLGARQGQFDMIYLGDVIEHFPKPALFPILDGIRQALRPGGFLLVRTNNAAGVAGMYLRYTSLTHELCFNERSLRKVLETAGFKTIKVFGERIGFRWRPRLIVWLLLRKIWYVFLKGVYTIEIGTDRPQVLTRLLLARGCRD